MAEVKEEQERAIYKDSTLERIMEKLVEKAKVLPYSEINFIDERSIGIYEYKKNGKLIEQKLYSITVVADGTTYILIIGEDGDRIATLKKEREKIEEKNGRRTAATMVSINPDKDIELNKEKLLNNMEIAGITQNNHQERDITERVETTMTDEEKKQQTKDIYNNDKLTNLVDFDVGVKDNVAVIDLKRMPYNGGPIKRIFPFKSKLNDRLPANIDIDNLDYLTVVNSADLTAKDGKARVEPKTVVIMDKEKNPNNMIEIDSSIMKPMENISKLDKAEADKNSQIIGDGKIKPGTKGTTDTKSICTYLIEGGASQPDDLLTLEIRYNPKTIDSSMSQRNDANDVEIYLGRLPKCASQNDQKFKKTGVDNYKLIKLEAVNEVRRPDEIPMLDLFRNDLGIDDEKYNILGVNIGEEEKEEAVRDAKSLNRQMKIDEKKRQIISDKQDKIEGNITAEVASQVNERQIAWDIIKESDEYGPRDIKYIYNLIMEKKAVMESHNETINNDVLKKRVQQDLKNQRTLGDMSNPRRVG